MDLEIQYDHEDSAQDDDGTNVWFRLVERIGGRTAGRVRAFVSNKDALARELTAPFAVLVAPFVIRAVRADLAAFVSDAPIRLEPPIAEFKIERPKQCNYQEERGGRELFCAASDTTKQNTTDETTLAGCARCDLPDVQVRCSHLVHVRVRTDDVRFIGDERGRTREIDPEVESAVCQIGRDVTPVQDCQAGGKPCWTRIVSENNAAVPHVDPTAIHDALDHLDTAWKAYSGKKKRLLKLTSTASIARLALACTDRSEFESRLSTIDDIVKKFETNVPDWQEGPSSPPGSIARLKLYFETHPSILNEAREDGLRALEKLQAVNCMRVGFQHSGAELKLLRAAAQLEIRWPVASWEEAWKQFAAQFVAALRNVRKALQTLDDE